MEYKILLRGSDGATYTQTYGSLKQELGLCKLESKISDFPTPFQIETALKRLDFLEDLLKPHIIAYYKKALLAYFREKFPNKSFRFSDIRHEFPRVWSHGSICWDAFQELVDEGALEQRVTWYRLRV